MASLSSPGYWDFDMFSEMRINTGGADVRNPTPGVAVDLVMKSGTNQFQGSMRSFFGNESLQKNNLSDALKESIGGDNEVGNRMEQYADYGFEVGVRSSRTGSGAGARGARPTSGCARSSTRSTAPR